MDSALANYVENHIISLWENMKDGDAHPDAIEETHALYQRGGEFKAAIGSLVFKRHETLDKGSFDNDFEKHDIVPDRSFYSVNLVEQHKGLVSVFENHDDALRLLAVVPIENFIYEMKTREALEKALELAQARYDT